MIHEAHAWGPNASYHSPGTPHKYIGSIAIKHCTAGWRWDGGGGEPFVEPGGVDTRSIMNSAPEAWGQVEALQNAVGSRKS